MRRQGSLRIACAIAAAGASGCALLLGLPDPALDDGAVVMPTDDGGPLGEAQASDASSDALAANDVLDGSEASSSCDPDAPFDPPTLISELASLEDDLRPTLSADELSIVFTQRAVGTPPSSGNIFRWKRATTALKWGGQELVAPATTADNGCLAPSGKLLYVTYYTGDIASLVESGGTFKTGTEQVEPMLSSASGTSVCGSVAANGSVYLHRTSGGFFRAERNATNTGFLAPAVEIASLAGTARTHPVISADERIVYYAHVTGAMNIDILKATRPTANAPFSNPTIVTELNSENDDVPGWLSPDGCRLYFSSNRKAPSGIPTNGYNQYVASKKKK